MRSDESKTRTSKPANQCGREGENGQDKMGSKHEMK